MPDKNKKKTSTALKSYDNVIRDGRLDEMGVPPPEDIFEWKGSDGNHYRVYMGRLKNKPAEDIFKAERLIYNEDGSYKDAIPTHLTIDEINAGLNSKLNDYSVGRPRPINPGMYANGGDLASKLNPNQYGFGSWLKDNAVPLLKTGAGAALTATGVGAPMGVGLMASGAGEMISNATNDPMAAQMGAVAGQAGGAFVGQPQLANGGELTRYNNGGTHEENPHKGVPVGQALVEEGETRWQDYIFSDRVKVPGKKFTFAEASKKIEAKYGKRKNDKYDDKAKEREMNALMAMQENERERLGLKQQEEMQEMFGCGGKMKKMPHGGPHPEGDGDPLKGSDVSGQTQYSNPQMAAATSLGAQANVNQLTPGDVDAELYPDLASVNVQYDGNTPILPQNIQSRLDETNTNLQNYQRKFASTLGLPTYAKKDALGLARESYPNFDKLPPNERKAIIEGYVGLPNPTQMDPNMSLTQEQIAMLDPTDLDNYYKGLEWKQAYRQRYGFTPKQYYGDIEAKEKGYTTDTPLRDLGLGIRMLTDNPTEVLKREGIVKAYGGKMKYSKGGYPDFSGLNNPTINVPNQQGFGQMGQGFQSGITTPYIAPDLNFNISVPNSQQGFGTTEGGFGSVGEGFQTGINTPDLASQIGTTLTPSDYTDGVNRSLVPNPEADAANQSGTIPTNTQGQGLGSKLGIFAAQNIGNLGNLALGMQGTEETSLGRASNPAYSLAEAMNAARSSYDSASKQAAENIRRNATSSGQALSNMIAANTSINKQKALQLAGLSEQEANTRAQQQAATERFNLGQQGREEELNQRQKAAQQQSLVAGLSGIGSSVAQFNRDNMAQSAQNKMWNAIQSGNYSFDENGKIIFNGNLG